MWSTASAGSRRRRRLELAWHGVDRGRPDTGYDREGSREIASPVEEPYGSSPEPTRLRYASTESAATEPQELSPITCQYRLLRAIR